MLTIDLSVLSSFPEPLVAAVLLPMAAGAVVLALRFPRAFLVGCYMLLLYWLTAALVFFYAPFGVAEASRSSIVVSVTLAVVAAWALGHVVIRRYRLRTTLLKDALFTLTRKNDDHALMLGVITHDFRNYLVRVLLRVQESRALCAEPRQLESLDDIETSLHELVTLLQEVRQVRDTAAAGVKPTAFADIVQKLNFVFRPQLVQKELALDVHAAADATVEVNGDVFVHIILANLLGNAIKFAPPGTSIGLDLVAAASGRRLVISNLATALQLDNLRRLARGEAGVESQRGTRDEDGQGLGVNITRRFCQAYDIAYSLAVEPSDSADLWQVRTTLAWH